ncbi:MAG: hypothetical protein AABZ44_06035, partial [Elusimicrobiota bacterium]
MSVALTLKRTLKHLRDVLLPVFCCGCDRYLASPQRKLCVGCQRTLLQVSADWNHETPTAQPLCALYSAGPYASEPLRTLLHRFKYHRQVWVFDELKEPIDGALGRLGLASYIDAVAAVPLHRQ